MISWAHIFSLAGSFGALLGGWLVDVMRGLYLARHLSTVLTRLTYNCAHLRLKKESLAFEYLKVEKEENIWRRKFLRRKKTEKEKQENISCGGVKNWEGKGGKYLQKENNFCVGESQQRRKRRENIMEKEILLRAGGRTDVEGSKRGPRSPKKCLSYKHCNNTERRIFLFFLLSGSVLNLYTVNATRLFEG